MTQLPLSWAILEAILRSLKPSWSHLASWAKKDPLPPRGGARPDAGRGGEVNLPRRERQEVGKGSALDHLRPEGWWDLRRALSEPLAWDFMVAVFKMYLPAFQKMTCTHLHAKS